MNCCGRSNALKVHARDADTVMVLHLECRHLKHDVRCAAITVYGQVRACIARIHYIFPAAAALGCI